jgi:hypothetical protein
MRVDGLPFCRSQQRRGVAQPGRAPGSGPGGRRFKSSLPDQFFKHLNRASGFSSTVLVGKFDLGIPHPVSVTAIGT